MESDKNIVVAITGASGAIYAKVLLDTLLQLKDQVNEISCVITSNAKDVWKHELGDDSYKNYPYQFYEKDNFYAPFASGSSKYRSMIICPCSMGTLGRIAHGLSNDLITRAADVMLKERRKLILITRETPLNLIHIKNMEVIATAGGIICPASPSFYSKPLNINEAVSTVIDRSLDLIGLEVNTYRWGKTK